MNAELTMGITRTLWRTSSLYIREDLNVDATEDNLDEKGKTEGNTENKMNPKRKEMYKLVYFYFDVSYTCTSILIF